MITYPRNNIMPNTNTTTLTLTDSLYNESLDTKKLKKTEMDVNLIKLADIMFDRSVLRMLEIYA